MVYFLLFLHYGFYIFFIMCFIAFISALKQNLLIQLFSVGYLILFTFLEMAYVIYLLKIETNDSLIWMLWLFGLVISLFFSMVLWLCKKLDLTIWIPFSAFFVPLIVIPILIYLSLIYPLMKKHNSVENNILRGVK